MSEVCPLYPRKRTLDAASSMSAKCQKRTFMGDEPGVRFRPIWLLGKCSGARQNNLYFGELTRLCPDLY
jgi:hypothetical protein